MNIYEIAAHETAVHLRNVFNFPINLHILNSNNDVIVVVTASVPITSSTEYSLTQHTFTHELFSYIHIYSISIVCVLDTFDLWADDVDWGIIVISSLIFSGFSAADDPPPPADDEPPPPPPDFDEDPDPPPPLLPSEDFFATVL